MIKFTWRSMVGVVHSTIGHDSIRVTFSQSVGVHEVVIQCNRLAIEINSMQETNENLQSLHILRYLMIPCLQQHQLQSISIQNVAVDALSIAQSYRPWLRHHHIICSLNYAYKKFWPPHETHHNYHRCSLL